MKKILFFIFVSLLSHGQTNPFVSWSASNSAGTFNGSAYNATKVSSVGNVTKGGNLCWENACCAPYPNNMLVATVQAGAPCSSTDYLTNTYPSTVDPSTMPYMEFSFNVNGTQTINWDKFVIDGIDPGTRVKLDVRSSLDNYATSLGWIQVLEDGFSNYFWGATDISELNTNYSVVSGQIKFRIYPYNNTYGNGSIGFNDYANVFTQLGNSEGVSYSAATYHLSTNKAVSIWASATSVVPTIASFSPTSASVGTTVTITGTNFSNATAVKFNGTNAASYTVNSATSITATVPSGATSGPISVTTSNGTGTSSGNFTITVATPTISSFSPTSASVGTTVTITGTNFSNATAVKFNGTNAASYTVNSATSITATVPSGATSGPISVTTSNGTGISSGNFTITVATPTISSFSPTSASVGTTVTITGTNFSNATAVKFNGTNAASYTVNSATSITATVPSGATTGSISVTTANGTGTSGGNFTVTTTTQSTQFPTITSFSPSSGVVGSSVTIIGTNFSNIASENIVYFGSTKAIVTSSSTTQLIVTVPKQSTHSPISVVVNGKVALAKSAFRVVNLSIASNVIDGSKFGNNIIFTSIGGSSNNDVIIAAGDFNSDGKTDIVKGGNGQVFVHNNAMSSSGTITTTSMSEGQSYTVSGAVNSLVVGDLNADGKLDIVTSSSSGISVLINTTSSGVLSFSSAINISGSFTAVRIADLNIDGLIDIAGLSSSGCNVYSNLTSNNVVSFSSATTISLSSYSGIDLGDMNGDGKYDVVATKSGETSVILNNSSNGVLSFAAPILLAYGNNKVVIVDLDADGDNDLFVRTKLVSNNFQSGTLQSTDFTDFDKPYNIDHDLGFSLTDFNGDGYPEVIVGSSWDKMYVYTNSAQNSISSSTFNGRWYPRQNLYCGSCGTGIGVDIDGDNKVDVVSSYRNQTSFTITQNLMSPIPTISVTGTLSTFTKCSGSTSTPQSFTVSGTNMSAGISIAALSGYEYSLSSNGTYTSTLTVGASGTINPTTVYVRLTAASTGSPSGSITLSSTGATNKTISATGSVTSLPTISGTLSVTIGSTSQLTGSGTAYASNPWTSSNTSVATVSNTGLITAISVGTSTITYTENTGCSITAIVTISNPTPTITVSGTLNAFTKCNGSASTPQSFSVSGANMEAGITIASLTGFEYSLTSNGTYTSTLTVGASGTITSTNVYVRMQSSANNASYAAANIVLSSTNATSKNISASGTVSTPDITGTLIIAVGATTQLTGNGTPATNNPWVSSATGIATISSTGLVTGISAGTTVITYTNSLGCSVTKTVTVLGANSICNHTITLRDSYGDSWNGGSVTVTTGGTTYGPYTVASGFGPVSYQFSAIQGNTITVNYTAGSWPYENYYSVSDGTGTILVADLQPSSYGTWTGTANCVGPLITVSGTLNAFTKCIGSTSLPQSFIVSGEYLNNGISIGALSGYEFCLTSDGTYTSTLTVGSSGTVNPTTVYVRLTATSTGSPSGNITLSSTGATNKTISASGSVVGFPTITLGTVSNVNTYATSFAIPFSSVTNSPTTYSVSAGSSALAGFTPIVDASFSGGSGNLIIPIPANSALGTYDFNITVKNATGCESSVYTKQLTITAASLANYGGVTIVSSGGATQGNGWVYNSNVIVPTSTSAVSINASDVVDKLALGSLTIEGSSITINASTTSTTLGSNLTLNASNTITINATTTIKGSITSNGVNIDVNANLITNSTNSGSILLKASGNIKQAAGVNITTDDSDVIFWSDADESGTASVAGGTIALMNASSIRTYGGNVVLAGGNDTNNDGIPDGYAIGAFATAVRGAQVSVNAGLSLDNASIDAGSGDVLIKGQGTGNLINFQIGTRLYGGSIKGTNITIDAIGSIRGASSSNWGLSLEGFTIEGSGNISLTGLGGRAGSSNSDANQVGVEIRRALDNLSKHSQVKATGNGTILINGIGGSGEFATVNVEATGIRIEASQINPILSENGDITLIGTSGYSGRGPAISIGSPIASTSGSIIFEGFQSTAGTLNLNGNIEIKGTIATDGDINITTPGDVTQTSSLSANELHLIDGAFTLTNTSNSVSKIIAGSNSTPISSLNYVNSNELIIGNNTFGVNATGTVEIKTYSEDLIVTKSISSAVSSGTAVTLVADYTLAANSGCDTTTSGANIVFSNPSALININENANARLFSGNPSQSTGMSTIASNTYYTASIAAVPSAASTTGVLAFYRVDTTYPISSIGRITGTRDLAPNATMATYSIPAVIGATSYVWDLPPGMTIISSTGPSVLVSVSSTFIGGNITVKAINGCSETLPVVLPITKQVLPLTISGSTVVCISTGSVTESYSVSPVEGATSYVWTVPGGSLITSGINTNSIEITYNTSFSRGTIRVSAIGSDGVISTGSLSVAGIELPGVITGSTQICTAGSYEYSIVAVEGATSYEWALPMGMTLQGDGSGTTISVVTNGSVSGTLSVRALSPCGSSQLQTLSISGVSRPGYIYGERIICGATSNSVDTNGNINTTSQNGVYTYSIIPVTGADSYTWSLPTGVILESGQGTRVIQVTFDSSFESGSIAVVANSLSCGSSPSRSVFVSSASVSIGGPSNICGLTSATYSVAAGVGSNYVWTLPEGMSISSGEGTNSITVSINHPINFSNNNNTVSLSFTTLCGGSKEVSLTVDCPDYSNLTNCGSTVAFNERVFTRSVSGATMYAFDIYDSTSSTLLTTYETRGNFFQFVQALSSFEFGTTYNVKVRVKRNGVYGLAGSACSITLATPVTAIQASQCNQTVNVQDRVYASSIWDGVTYAFDIYDSEGNLITTLEKISNFFRMSEFTSVYGMTYQVGVRVKRGNGFYGEQGSRCNITIAIPTTSLVVNQCGSTIDIADRIYARSVANATMYAFSIYDANGTFITELERPYNFFRITDISYILGASYQVGIRVKQGEGSYGLEGALCTITLSGPPTTAIESAQCGTSILYTDAIYAVSVSDATGYKFNVYNQAGTTLVTSFESATNSFSFSQLTGYTFDTTYQVRVQVIRGTEYGVEGTACSITVIKDAPARALSNQDEIKTSIESEFKAYPNPFTTTFSITPIEGETATLFYQVYDVTGKMMESRSVEANEITNHTIGEQYPAGMYLVIVRQGASTKTFKMVKQ